jgi:hypothetical protein
MDLVPLRVRLHHAARLRNPVRRADAISARVRTRVPNISRQREAIASASPRVRKGLILAMESGATIGRPGQTEAITGLPQARHAQVRLVPISNALDRRALDLPALDRRVLDRHARGTMIVHGLEASNPPVRRVLSIGAVIRATAVRPVQDRPVQDHHARDRREAGMIGPIADHRALRKKDRSASALSYS